MNTQTIFIIMKIVAKCQTPFEAEMIKGNLDNRGFHAVVFNNSLYSIYGLTLGAETMTIEVRVPDEEFDEASRWMSQEDEAQQAAEQQEETTE